MPGFHALHLACNDGIYVRFSVGFGDGRTGRTLQLVNDSGDAVQVTQTGTIQGNLTITRVGTA